MNQADRGDYRKQKTFFEAFYQSCFGKSVIAIAILGILILIAYLTCPSREYMKREMSDNILQCMQEDGARDMDALDNAVANLTYIFTSADTVIDREMVEIFRKYNRLEIYEHGTFITMYVFNTLHPEGVRCAIGAFGVVVPTLKYTDLLLDIDPILRESKKKTIEIIESDPFLFGDTPNLIFREDEYY